MDTDSPATDVQPADAPEGAPVEGQGAEGIQGLYDLSAAPEHLRPLLEQELKKVDANVTRRFQEHADFRSKYEPLEALEGLTDVPAEELGQLLEFREIASNPEHFESWWYQVGKDLGFFEDDGSGPEAGGPEEPEAGTSPEISQLVETVQQLSQRLEQFEQQGEQEKATAEIRAEQERQLAALREQHGEFDEDLVLRLARDYISEPDYVSRGFEDYLRMTGQAQSTLVEDKLEQPGPSTSGGRPDTGASTPQTFKEAQAAALQRLGG